MTTLLGQLIKAQHATQIAYFQALEAGLAEVAHELREAGISIADAISLLRDTKRDERTYS